MSADDVLHADLCELLNALGLGAHARPYSAHEVMQREILPAVRALTDAQVDVLAEVAAERARQDEKWGEQNHPDVHGLVVDHPERVPDVHGIPSGPDAKLMTNTRAAVGLVSWADIAVEELAEALESAAEGDPDAVRAEVVQLAAVCVQWVQAIDRREAVARLDAGVTS